MDAQDDQIALALGRDPQNLAVGFASGDDLLDADERQLGHDVVQSFAAPCFRRYSVASEIGWRSEKADRTPEGAIP